MWPQKSVETLGVVVHSNIWKWCSRANMQPMLDHFYQGLRWYFKIQIVLKNDIFVGKNDLRI